MGNEQEYNNFPNQNDNWKGEVIGTAVQAGAGLLQTAVSSICNAVNKAKDVELEKLRIENERLIQKEQQKKELIQNMKLELEKKENDFLEKQIIIYQYDENLLDKGELMTLFNGNLVNNILDKIKNNLDLLKQIDNKISDLIKESKSTLKKNERLNIFIMGKTGVGKTCLKNAICEKLYSQEKMGERGTLERARFLCECHNYLSITDNIGFELKGEYNLQNLTLDNNKYIMEKIKSNDEAIHCIWYCLTGTKLEDEEFTTICDLRKLYKENNIPLIIVYLQAIEPEKFNGIKTDMNEKLKKENNEEIGEKPENVQYIPLLSKQTTVTIGQMTIPIKPYNLSKLIEKTYNAYEYSVDLVNKKCLIEIIKEKIKNEYDNKLLSCLEIIKGNKIIEDNFDYLIGVLCEQLANYKINQILEMNFIKNKILTYISEKYKKFKEEKERKILFDIMNIQNEFCNNNSNEDINLGLLIKSENEFKAEIEHRIDYKNIEEFKIFYFDKISKIFFDYFAQELTNKILELFWNEIEREKIKNEIYILSKIGYNKINEGIQKLVNELKKKES